MRQLFIMNAPNTEADPRRAAALELLRAVVEVDPDITWGELTQKLDDYVNGIDVDGSMNGFFPSFNDITRILGKAGKGLWRGTKELVGAVFDKKKVSDSLKEAAQGIGDDALDRFVDALPFGIGKDLKSGHVFNALWPVAIVLVVLLVLMMRRKKGK